MKILKNLGFSLILLGLFLYTIDSVSAYVSSISEEKEFVVTVRNNIEEQYSLFMEKAKNYKDELQKLSPFYKQYYEEIPGNDKIHNATLKTIDYKFMEANQVANILNDYCSNNIAEENIVKKCDAFNKTYSSMSTSFDNVVKRYNYTIEEYNLWAETINNKVLEKYTPVAYN